MHYLHNLGIIQPLAEHFLDKLEDLLQHHHHLEEEDRRELRNWLGLPQFEEEEEEEERAQNHSDPGMKRWY